MKAPNIIMGNDLIDIDLKEVDERDFFDTLKNITGERVQDISLNILKGDASDRRYLRIGYKTDNNSNSIVVMVLSCPHNGELPFINVQRHFKKCGVAVPEIYHYDGEKGLLFMEDCGDITLEEWLKEKNEITKIKYYKKIIDSLLNIQIRGSDKNIGECVAFELRFDVEKLMWELNFMIEHMIFGLLNKRMDNMDLDKMREYLLDICKILSYQKPYLNHRDYHSRNIMVKNMELKFLDFQDARMGPCQYDLCSLLRDSYMMLDDELADELIEYYISNKERIEGEYIDRLEFRKVFDYMSIQRNLKAIGTFAYQKMVKGNDRYLTSIPVALEYVRANINKYENLSGLRNILYKYLLS